jgi:hypothetical protein
MFWCEWRDTGVRKRTGLFSGALDGKAGKKTGILTAGEH